MKLFIVTGASKGLGKEILRLLMRPGHRLVGVARGEEAELREEAHAKGVPLQWISSDLSHAETLPKVMDEALAGLDGSAFSGCYLINNAGTIEPVAPLSRCSSSQIMQGLMLNLAAPMVLTADFLRLTAGWQVERRVLNISSGAGKHPYFGWSVYCASKAGLDMFTRCAGEEQRGESNEVRVLSVAPGVVDTDMQRRIRETDADLFRERDRFVKLKQSGKLTRPEEAADKVLRVLFDDRYPNGSVLDVRELFSSGLGSD